MDNGMKERRKREKTGVGRKKIPVEFQRFFIARSKPRQLRNRSFLQDTARDP
jgi:hypothetical protein